MKNILFFLLFFSVFVYSQDSLNQEKVKALNKVLSETDTLKLRELARIYKLQGNMQKVDAIDWAIKNNQPLRKVLPNGVVIELQGIDKNGKPVYYITHNINSAKTISTDKIQPGGLTGLNLTGSGIDIGIWDEAVVYTSHQSLYPQVEIKDDEANPDTGDHATHVTGTMIANGVVPNAKGMAPNAKVYSYNWTNDIEEMIEAAINIPGEQKPLFLSNHSYGITAGWYQPGEDWIWYGDNNVPIDYNFGYYDQRCISIDQLVNLAPYHTIVWSAGNSRGKGPEPYTEHKHANDPDGTYTDLHYKNGGDTGFDCIAHESLAKNIITVGAVDDLPNGYQGPSSVVQQNTSFSSWGPTNDGRIKPDIVANGDNLYSSVYHDSTLVDHQTGNYYFKISGTSMATPSVTGSIALLIEYYKNKHNQDYPKASTLKALIIHTADECGDNPGPDFSFGWGLMNSKKATDVILRDVNFPNTIQQISLDSGKTFSQNVVATGNEPLLVTISWTDPPSSTPTGPVLINDLDLRIIQGSNTFMPWKLNANNPSQPAYKGDNSTDNVEQVLIEAPLSGQIYTINVTCKNSLNSPQSFSIIMNGFQTSTSSNLITINQRDANGDLFGNYFVWHQFGYWASGPSGETIVKHDPMLFKASQQFKPGTFQKFNFWQNNLSNKFYLNWNYFTYLANVTELTAQFINTTENTEIQNYSLEGNVLLNGNIYFSDPWLTDSNQVPYGLRNRGLVALSKKQTSPFIPDYTTSYNGDIYQGVFLNQPYTGNNPVYYSVKVDEVQSIDLGGTIGARDFYFLNWSAFPPESASFQNADALETAVVFKSENATVRANLKGHLFTNSTSATASNNQRKIVQGSNGYWALIYVSMDQVWLSRSTDGVNWEREIKISSYLPANSPHISISGNTANIIWQETNWQGGNGFDFAGIYLRSYNLSDNTLGQTILVDSFIPNSDSFQATPVIDGEWSPSYTSEMFVWREPDGLKTKRYTNSYGWSNKGTISGTNSYSINPSIVDYNSSIFFICWEDAANHKIKYIEASYGTSWSFFSATDVSPSYWSENMNPQMTLVGGNKPTIVWTSLNDIVEGRSSVHIRQRSGLGTNNTWGNITSFSPQTPGIPSPVIGDYYGLNKMDVLWDISNSIYKASYNGTSWAGPTTLTTSGGSGVNINRTTAYQIKALWKKSDNTIAFYSVGGTAPPAKITADAENEIIKLPYRLNRHAIIELPKDIDSTAKGSVCFEIAGISTLYNNSETKINYSFNENNLLASEPFRIAAENIQLKFSGAIYGAGLELQNNFISSINEPLAKVVLKDSKTNESLQNLWVNNPSMLNKIENNTFGEFRNVSVDLNKYLGKTVYVQVEMIGKSKGIKPLIVDDYLILSDSTSIAENLANKTSTDYVQPIEYTLMQNFPNPFNPNTTITFFLREAQNTTLKIYNVLGKEVMIVVNENLAEGYHSVDVNMSNKPSGVYLYSLSAGSFRDTKKLMLLK